MGMQVGGGGDDGLNSEINVTPFVDVMLVLLSFILAWGEVWFIDFRVLPLQEQAKEIHSRRNGGGGPTPGNTGGPDADRSTALHPEDERLRCLQPQIGDFEELLALRERVQELVAQGFAELRDG